MSKPLASTKKNAVLKTEKYFSKKQDKDIEKDILLLSYEYEGKNHVVKIDYNSWDDAKSKFNAQITVWPENKGGLK